MVYIEAYDKSGVQILGTGDGQGVINAKNYKRTKHYKSLRTRKTLDNRVKYYDIGRPTGSDRYSDCYEVLERVYNINHEANHE